MVRNLRVSLRSAMFLGGVALSIAVGQHGGAAETSPFPTHLDPGWTREGALPAPPVRATDAFPLSDQANRSGWQRVDALSDEFNGTEPDRSRWFLTNDTWHGRVPFAFDPANVRERDGDLVLTASALVPEPQKAKLPSSYTHTAAFVRSRNAFLYGYVEIRALLARTTVNSCFFLMDTTAESSTEIDVFEIAAADPNSSRRLGMSRHVLRAPGFAPQPGHHLRYTAFWGAPESLGARYHVFGIEWTRSKIAWYVDGVLVHEAKNEAHHYPLRVILDLEPNQPYEADPMEKLLPADFRIDYVRVWSGGDGSAP